MKTQSREATVSSFLNSSIPMRILIIGGTGFIGPALATQLTTMGHQVTVFHRGQTTGGLPASVNHMLGERRDLPQLTEAFRQVAPDVVVDVILSSGRQAQELMNTFHGIAGRVVALSSIDVYRACGVLHASEPGPLEPVPLTEDSPLRQNPQTYPPEVLRHAQAMYPWIDEEYNKIPVERAILSDPELPGTILRLPMVYGPGDRGHRLFPILKRIDDRRPAILLEETFSRMRAPRGYVANVAAAVALATVSDRAKGRIYNVAEPEAFSELEWTRKVGEIAGWRGAVIVVPTDRAPAHLKPAGNFEQHWTTDSTRLRRELGYRELVPLDEALAQTIAWERAHPPEEIDPKQFDYAAEDAVLAEWSQ